MRNHSEAVLSKLIRSRQGDQVIVTMEPWNEEGAVRFMSEARYWVFWHGVTPIIRAPAQDLKLSCTILDFLQPISHPTLRLELDKRRIASGATPLQLAGDLLLGLRMQSDLLYSDILHLQKLAEQLKTPVSTHARIECLQRFEAAVEVAGLYTVPPKETPISTT